MTEENGNGQSNVSGQGDQSTARALSGQLPGAERHHISGTQSMVYMAKIRIQRANGSRAAARARD